MKNLCFEGHFWGSLAHYNLHGQLGSLDVMSSVAQLVNKSHSTQPPREHIVCVPNYNSNYIIYNIIKCS